MLIPSTPFVLGGTHVGDQRIDAVVVEPHAIDDALHFGKPEHARPGLPGCARGDGADLDEAEAEAASPSIASPFLSRPAARPTRLGKSMPITLTGWESSGLAAGGSCPPGGARRW